MSVKQLVELIEKLRNIKQISQVRMHRSELWIYTMYEEEVKKKLREICQEFQDLGTRVICNGIPVEIVKTT